LKPGFALGRIISKNYQGATTADLVTSEYSIPVKISKPGAKARQPGEHAPWWAYPLTVVLAPLLLPLWIIQQILGIEIIPDC
jgi:hypothetical protein